MSISDELQKLQQLHESGSINDEEYVLAKAKALSGWRESPAKTAAARERAPASPEALDEETRRWAMLLHLSMLAGYVVPVAGLAIPILIWQWKKTELPGIDPHGKNALNWILSMIIYGVICFILVFAVIGIPLLMVLGALGLVFPIIAAIKANDGEVWRYPLSISFFK